ncbi:hypothetical protein KIS1582_3013 [Cytobacillus firmus]|uniref:Uncharacterized protein n=1 Tax=Cytobacillus firmus TaxID=1399 RepID=A0A800NA35_CYTFI|nr:hypothetical protein KIS1582_3013 [Cytobacillus firmus]
MIQFYDIFLLFLDFVLSKSNKLGRNTSKNNEKQPEYIRSKVHPTASS